MKPPTGFRRLTISFAVPLAGASVRYIQGTVPRRSKQGVMALSSIPKAVSFSVVGADAPNKCTVLTQPDISPTSDQLVQSIQEHDGPIIIDLDETLYLRNSTEDFIDTAAPGLFGRLVFAALEVMRPWRLLGGVKTRDAWRVRVAAMFPFAARRWEKRAKVLGSTEVHQPIRNMLESRKDAVIATLGFKPVVKPLLTAMQLTDHRLVACEMGSLRDRNAGKLALVRAAIGEDAVQRCAVLTDSVDDQDILDACARPILVKWPAARFVPAHRGIYLPLEYTHRIKRPGLSFIQRSILGDDYMAWLVASIVIASAPISHAIGLLLLILSFWTIYELGYVDNDRVGERYEANPTLTPEYHRISVATSTTQAWIWALGLGAAGVAVIERDFAPWLTGFAAWSAALVATYAVYLLYNRVDKSSRIWLYGLLQLARAASFLVVVPVTAFGVIALAAHAVSRWIVYFVYRVTKREWPVEIPTNILRLFVFILIAVPVAASMTSTFDTATLLTGLLVLAWFSIRSGPRLPQIFAKAHLIKTSQAKESGSPLNASVPKCKSDLATPSARS